MKPTITANRCHVSSRTLLLLLAIVLGTPAVQANNLFWNLATGGAWDIGTTANWTGGATTFANGDTVNFTNTAGGIVTIDAGGVLPGAITNSAASGTYTFTNGAIGGSGALIMNGGGTLVLKGTNTYNGGTYANAGQVQAASSTAAFGFGNVTVASGGNVGFSGGTAANTTNAFTLNGTGNGVGAGALRFLNSGTVLSGPITLGANASLTGLGNLLTGTINLGSFTLTNAKNAAVSDIFSGNIADSGGGGLTMAGVNATTTILTLTGTNTYTGPTTLTLGELSVSATNHLGAPTANLVFNGGTLQITGTNLTTLSGLGHAVSFNVNRAVGLDINSAANTFTADQVLNQGTGTFTKLGAGKLVLNQANTYTGVTTVSGGILQLAGGTGNAIPSGGSAVTLAGGTLDMNGQVQTIYNLQTGGTATTNVLTDSSGGGVLTTIYNATGTLVATNNTLIINGGTLNQGSGGLGQYVCNGTLTVAGGTLNVPQELLNGFNTANSVINLNSGVINVSSVSFGNAACTYRLNGGIIQCDNFKRRSTGAVDLFFNGVTVKTRSTTFGNFLPTATFTAGQNAWISTGGATFDSTNLSIIISCALQHDTLGSATDGGLTKTGSGTLTLSATNTYNGATLVSAGTLAEAATGFIADTSPLTVNGSTAIFALGASHSDTVGTVTLMNGGSITGSGSSTLTVAAGTYAMQNGTVSAILAGAGIALNKTTSGTVTLVGANTYTGPTAISAGKLVISSAQTGTGTITVSANAALGVTVSGVSQLAPSTLTFGGTTTNEFSGLSGTTTAPVNAGVLNKTGTTTINIVSGTFVSGQSYPLIHFTTTSGTGGFVLDSKPIGLNATVSTNGNNIVLNVTSVSALLWTGNVNGDWDTTTLNWSTNSVAATYSDGRAVQFDDTATGSALVTNTVTVSPSAIVVSNNSNSYTFSGSPISGAGSLTKNGTGSLKLSGANSYTGPTIVNAGIVQVSSPTAFGATGAGNDTTVGSAGEIDLAAGTAGCAEPFTLNTTTGNGALRFVNSGQTLNGTITLGSNSKVTGLFGNLTGTINLGSFTLEIAKNAGQADSWSAIILGTGGLLLSSASTLTLSGANTYTGPTTINAGTVSVGTIGNGGVVSGNLGSASSAAANLVLGGGTLKYTGTTASTDRGFTLASVIPASSIEVTSGSTALTLGGASAATSGALTKTGAGMLILAGANLHSGMTTISNGTLALVGSGSIANSTEIYVVSGATLDVSSISAPPFTVGAAQTLSGDGTVAGAARVNGTLAPGTGFGTGGTLTFNDPLTLAAGSTTVMQIARNGATLANAQVQAANPLTFAGTLVIANVGGSLLQAGDTFQLFTGGSRSGSFTSIVYPPGYTFTDNLVANGSITVATAPPGPGFSNISASNGTLSLTWPANYQGWLVQSNSVNLADTNYWFDIAGSDIGTVLNMALTNPSLTKCFFRMHSQSSADFASDPMTNGAGLAIDSVWSGDVVGFAFLTLKDVQIAAYYNTNRYLTFAARNLNSTNWYYQTTTEQFAGWDVHNYIAMDVDPTGYLHVSANMHNQPMNYFRSTQPITNAVQFQTPGLMPQLSPLWNSAYESQCTYPDWFRGPNNEFIFTYRSRIDGFTGSWHFLKYDTGTKTFSQPSGFSTPVFTWTTNYSVYPNYYVMGGSYHILYVWRRGLAGVDNYRLSYVRSTNLVNWTDAFGRAVTLPIGSTATLPIVDDICQSCGLLNGQPQLTLDRDGVPLAAYSKFDGAGHSQVYVARPNPATLSWNIVQLTTNNYWGVNLNNIATTNSSGSVGNGFAGDDPGDGLVTVGVGMTDIYGVRDPNSGNYTLDETTLTNVVVGSGPVTTLYASANTPNAFSSYVDSSVLLNTYYDTNRAASMSVSRTRFDGVGFANLHYYARWEALPSDNSYGTKYDQNGNVINPTPSALTLYRTAADFDASVYGSMFKPANALLYGAMARTADVARTFGTLLSSAVAGTANYAQWTFNAYTAGEYALGGSTYAGSGSSNSFWVQVDNGPLIDWRLTAGGWNYQPVTAGATKGQMLLSLSRGSHSVRLYAQAVGAKFEYLWLNQPSLTKASSLGPLTHTGFTLTADARAVSGYTLSSASNPAGFTAHYEVPVFQTGNYLLLGRTRALNTSSDTFNLSLNGGTPQLWTLPISGTNWTWQAVGTSQTLSAGTLNLDVTGQEAGAALDAFMLLKLP